MEKNNSDRKIIDEYIKNNISDEILSAFHAYYKHDIIKICKFCGLFSIFIESVKFWVKNTNLYNYVNIDFEKKPILVLRDKNLVYCYTARDIIYAHRGFIHHGKRIGKEKYEILDQFLLGEEIHVLMCVASGNIKFYDELHIKNKDFEYDNYLINNKKFNSRDAIIMGIWLDLIYLLDNKEFKRSISFPEKAVINKDKELVKKLLNYYPNLKLDMFCS